MVQTGIISITIQDKHRCYGTKQEIICDLTNSTFEGHRYITNTSGQCFQLSVIDACWFSSVLEIIVARVLREFYRIK